MPSEEIHKNLPTQPETTPPQEKKPEENLIESKKQNIQTEKSKLEAKKRNIQEISEGNATYQESL